MSRVSPPTERSSLSPSSQAHQMEGKGVHARHLEGFDFFCRAVNDIIMCYAGPSTSQMRPRDRDSSIHQMPSLLGGKDDRIWDGEEEGGGGGGGGGGGPYYFLALVKSSHPGPDRLRRLCVRRRAWIPSRRSRSRSRSGFIKRPSLP